jgi:hypothetical protein
MGKLYGRFKDKAHTELLYVFTYVGEATEYNQMFPESPSYMGYLIAHITGEITENSSIGHPVAPNIKLSRPLNNSELVALRLQDLIDNKTFQSNIHE